MMLVIRTVGTNNYCQVCLSNNLVVLRFKLNVLKKPIPLEESQQKKVSPVGEHGNISSPLPLQR